MKKLYQPYSTVPEYLGHKGVRVYWYCERRPYPLGTYTDLISNYDRLNDHQKPYAQGCVDELLTEAEVAELRRYLLLIDAIDGPDFVVEEIALPTEAGGLPFREHDTKPSGSPTGWVELSENEGYDLSIPICGYYNLKAAEDGPWVKIRLEEQGVGGSSGAASERTVDEFSKDVMRETPE